VSDTPKPDLKWGNMAYRLAIICATTIPSTKGETNALGTYRFVFGHMILRKIMKNVATKCQILRLQ